jgi:hypothetical protein
MKVKELLQKIIKSGCSLDDELCLVTKFDYQQVHHLLHNEEEQAKETGPLAEHLMQAMCEPDFVTTTRESDRVLILEFHYNEPKRKLGWND